VTYDAGLEALVGSEPAFGFTVSGEIGQAAMTLDMQPMAQFLTQRALEIEQARVEAMQAALLEKQRLRREVRYYAALQDERERLEAERLRAEEEARLKAEEAARLKAEEEAQAKAAEEARLKAEEEAKAKAAEEEARRKAEEEAQAAERTRREQEEAARAAERSEPAAVLPDMAGERPAANDNAPADDNRPVPRADVGPQQQKEQDAGGFSLDSLFRSLGAGN
jgi:membrane protein involved in colicin uptake